MLLRTCAALHVGVFVWENVFVLFLGSQEHSVQRRYMLHIRIPLPHNGFKHPNHNQARTLNATDRN